VEPVSSSPPNYSAMTVNERLFVAGLLDRWEAAINHGDRAAAIHILSLVDMDVTSASSTVDTTLANPTKYGFPEPTC
jgi:hypothetical protein